MDDQAARLFDDRIALRTASPMDKDAVSALLELSYSHLLAGSYDAHTLELALPYMVRAKAALLASGTYYVAQVESGGLVGCGGWTPEDPGSGETVKGEAHIRHFAVHPDWIKRGIGKALLARCIAEAESSGIHRLHCLSTLNAEPFYRASGFQTVDSIDVQMGPGIVLPAVLMRREIP